MLEGSGNSSLKARGFLKIGKNAHGEKTYRLTKDAPIYIQLREDTAMDIRDLIDSVGDSYPLSQVLKQVEDKLILSILSRDTEEENLDEPYGAIKEKGSIIYGRRYNKNPGIMQFLRKMNHVHYETNPVRIVYQEKTKRTFSFLTGLFFYASDKDRLYLIGRDEAAPDQDVILNTDRILEIEDIPGQNPLFQNDYYMQIFEEMFSVSVEEPVYVKVEFDDLFNIYRKIGTLQSFRPNSKISRPRKGIILYEDDLRGIEDFAKYLRSYGRAVKVLEPEQLRNRMRRTAELMAQRYGIEEIRETGEGEQV